MDHFETTALTLQEANEFITTLHRHHQAVHRDKFRVGAMIDGRLVGVVQVGRPINRNMDDGKTVEVVRCCTDGTKNACSFLYGKACQISKLLGFKRVITYILASENGSSVLASGFVLSHETKGREWNCPSRPRGKTKNPVDKKCYVKEI